MTDNAGGWLSAAACWAGTSLTLPPVREVQFRHLSPRDKRELAGLTAAGIATTALVFVSLIIPAAHHVSLPSASLPVRFAAAPVLSPALPVRIPTRPALARREPRPRVLNASFIVARPISAPVVLLTARADNDPGESGGTARRNPISRVLLGDGRYRVRPFPTPADRN